MTAKDGQGRAGTAPSAGSSAVEPFAAVLEKHGLRLVRGETRALQINTGPLCDRSCRHCHLEAGPGRAEVMSRGTMEQVVAFAKRNRFAAIDVTGGAPELVPDLPYLLDGLAGLAPRLMLRSSLAALPEAARGELLTLCVARRVVLIASLPSTNFAQTDAQRGAGAAEAAIAALRMLNAAGYGVEGSGLELNLVSNPVGAFLPAAQSPLETRFRHDLLAKWGVAFNHLNVFANVPLGRFRMWLVESGNHDRYLRTLADRFNPCAVGGLMCRTQLSISWDGATYDCDFNLAAGLPIAGDSAHLPELQDPPPPGTPIAVGDHCYACTAGSGFT